jgi:hypothetical protein
MIERPGELTIDHNCEIFMNCTEAMKYLAVVYPQQRIVNGATNSWPCLLHFNGGYTDQKTGKWYRMKEMWRRLGYLDNPPWERQ